jgi:predicted dehydrogenase
MDRMPRQLASILFILFILSHRTAPPSCAALKSCGNSPRNGTSRESIVFRRDKVLAFHAALVLRCDTAVRISQPIAGKDAASGQSAPGLSPRHLEPIAMQTPTLPRQAGNTRRHFLKTSAVGIAAFSFGRVLGANERVGVGIIGFGLIGRIHTRSFMRQPDVDVVGIAETYQPRLEAGAGLVGGKVTRYRDFRRMLEKRDIDAVVVATPDHWHALQTMLACAAGKDVYVEKPLTLFVSEGRWMVDIARRYQRVVQVGTQNRSGPNFQRAREFLQAGKLGQIVSAQSTFFRNTMPGFGNPPDQDPPPELDWEMWLGPAPYHAYNPNRAIYHFRWFWDCSGGQQTNLGQHSLDLVHWFTGAEAPTSAYSTGGRHFLKDNGEVPDTQDTILEYPGFVATCQYREATAGRSGQGMGGLAIYGTHGSDLESGHRIATACHLANISLRTGRKISWNAAKESVIDDREAARMLTRPYRKPWGAELKALRVG